MTTDFGRLALSVNELEEGEFHYVLMEAVTMPGDLLCFRPREMGERAHSSPMDAWFSGLGVVRRLTSAQSQGPVPPGRR